MLAREKNINKNSLIVSKFQKYGLWILNKFAPSSTYEWDYSLFLVERGILDKSIIIIAHVSPYFFLQKFVVNIFWVH